MLRTAAVLVCMCMWRVCSGQTKTATFSASGTESETVTGSVSQTVGTETETETQTGTSTMTVGTATETATDSMTVPTASATETVSSTETLTQTASQSDTATDTVSQTVPTVTTTETSTLSITETASESITQPTATATESLMPDLPHWEKAWYYQSPFSSKLFDITPTEVVQADKTTFKFTGYLADEGTPVVFLRQPESGLRRYNICSELLPNEEWVVESMNTISGTGFLTETLNNGTQEFVVTIDGNQYKKLVVDSSTLVSNQVGDWTKLEEVPYYVCVRPDSNGWNALETIVTVKQENATDSYYGYQTCGQLLAAHSELCGCYFSVGTYTTDDNKESLVSGRQSGWIPLDVSYPLENLKDVDQRMRFRSGCCASFLSESSALTKDYPIPPILSSAGAWLPRSWGTCASSEQAYRSSLVY